MPNRDHRPVTVLAIVGASINQHSLHLAPIPGLLQVGAVRPSALLAEPAGVMNHMPLGWLGVSFPLHHRAVTVQTLLGWLILWLLQVIPRWFHPCDLCKLSCGVLVPTADDPGLNDGVSREQGAPVYAFPGV